jgi:hypothetical protein
LCQALCLIATRSSASCSCRACALPPRTDMSQTRRLAAILAADVAGYSRLTGTPSTASCSCRACA